MISHGKDIKIFTGNANPKLAADICKIIGTKLGESEVKSFADGEASVFPQRTGTVCLKSTAFMLCDANLHPQVSR